MVLQQHFTLVSSLRYVSFRMADRSIVVASFTVGFLHFFCYTDCNALFLIILQNSKGLRARVWGELSELLNVSDVGVRPINRKLGLYFCVDCFPSGELIGYLHFLRSLPFCGRLFFFLSNTSFLQPTEVTKIGKYLILLSQHRFLKNQCKYLIRWLTWWSLLSRTWRQEGW